MVRAPAVALTPCACPHRPGPGLDGEGRGRHGRRVVKRSGPGLEKPVHLDVQQHKVRVSGGLCACGLPRESGLGVRTLFSIDLDAEAAALWVRCVRRRSRSAGEVGSDVYKAGKGAVRKAKRGA